MAGEGDVAGELGFGVDGVGGAVVGLFVGVDAQDVVGQAGVVGLVGLVQHYVDEVETGEDCGGEVDVLHDALFGVVTGVYGVGGGQDCCAGVQTTHDTSFGNRYSLLLHRL